MYFRTLARKRTFCQKYVFFSTKIRKIILVFVLKDSDCDESYGDFYDSRHMLCMGVDPTTECVGEEGSSLLQVKYTHTHEKVN